MKQIIHGRCEEIFDRIPDESVDAIITDPPFGIGFDYGGVREDFSSPEAYWGWFGPIYDKMLAKVKPGGLVAIWQTQVYYPYFWTWYGMRIHIYVAAKNFVQIRKRSPVTFAYDPIILFYKPGADPIRPNPKRNLDFFVANTAAQVSKPDNLERQHPCPRPLDQALTLIENFVVEDGIVLDPFLGSGTVAVACERLGRGYIGIEVNESYVALSHKRIAKERGEDTC